MRIIPKNQKLSDQIRYAETIIKYIKKKEF